MMKTTAIVRAGILIALLVFAGCALTRGRAQSEGEREAVQLDSLVAQAVETIRGIDGPDQARAASRTLSDVSAQLAAIVERSRDLPAESRERLGAIAAVGMSRLETATEHALAIPGVEEIIGQGVTGLSRNLQDLM